MDKRDNTSGNMLGEILTVVQSCNKSLSDLTSQMGGGRSDIIFSMI